MLSQEMEVAQIVLDHSECAAVLQRHRIDYCCKGRLPLVEACQERGADAGQVLRELEQAIAQRGETNVVDPRRIPTGELLDHIVRRHHAYLKDTLPFVMPLAEKVARVHGAHNPRLLEVCDAVETLAELMLPHMEREEQVLFPALATGSPSPDLVADELATMYEDHLAVAKVLEKLREASEDFAVPEWGCTSYATLYRELKLVVSDTFQHVHLENHVLMPRFAKA
jgi:regulator of cell morphogenesis and NO signaling